MKPSKKMEPFRNGSEWIKYYGEELILFCLFLCIPTIFIYKVIYTFLGLGFLSATLLAIHFYFVVLIIVIVKFTTKPDKVYWVEKALSNAKN
jgi:hypothetical protein